MRFCVAVAVVCLFVSLTAAQATRPVHSGMPNVQPFWNTHAARFIYPPAFEFARVNGATRYRFTIECSDGSKRDFLADSPWAPLSPVWNQIPEGFTRVRIDAIGDKDKGLSACGDRTFYRSPGFSAPTTRATVSYKDAGRAGLKAIFDAPHVRHWLIDGKPDRTYARYCYPAKVMGGLMRGMVAYSRIAQSQHDRDDALQIAKNVADHLIEISIPVGDALSAFPPTYSLDVDNPVPAARERAPARWLMVPSAADTALGYLDLYQATHDQRYLDAAKRIAATYARTQESDGTWPLQADFKTGKAIAPQRTVPTWIIWLFDRLSRDYGVSEYATVRDRAWKWIEDNPLKTYQWDGQFEDVKPRGPYENLAREQACDVAVMLFADSKDHPERAAQADELLRFAEDQFVVWSPVKFPQQWEQAMPNRRKHMAVWITPCVLEQYACYDPVARSNAIVMNTYIAGYKATGNKDYLARAEALAGGMIEAQKWLARDYNGNGEIPTWQMRNKPINWLNNSYYAADALLNLAEVAP